MALLAALGSPELELPWYRAAPVDVACVLLLALLAVFAAVRMCWISCGVLMAALKAECYK